MSDARSRRRRRLAEELEESGLRLRTGELRDVLLDEIDHALRPAVHERRVVSSGMILDPRSDPTTWTIGSRLDISHGPVGDLPLPAARRFADGLSSFLVRRPDGGDEWMVFDRPAGSERDLVVLSHVLDATIVQRHPNGWVRVVGDFGVLRWNGYFWHHEPPLATWIGTVTAGAEFGDPNVLEAMLAFAIHDLGSLRVGALLVYRPDPGPGPSVEDVHPVPPPLRIGTAPHLAPLRHALAQIDGAAMFDGDGVLRQLGVRLVPSRAAHATVDAFGGTRHTSGLRYSYDDPRATVVAVSDDGPVSVFRGGAVLGRSHSDE